MLKSFRGRPTAKRFRLYSRFSKKFSHATPILRMAEPSVLRAISAWLKERARMKPTGKAFFVSEQRKPLHRSTVNLLLRK